MSPKRRRDRNAFLVFLAAVPIALLVAMPAAVSTGNSYVAAKQAKELQAREAQQQSAGAGATAPQGGK